MLHVDSNLPMLGSRIHILPWLLQAQAAAEAELRSARQAWNCWKAAHGDF